MNFCPRSARAPTNASISAFAKIEKRASTVKTYPLVRVSFRGLISGSNINGLQTASKVLFSQSEHVRSHNNLDDSDYTLSVDIEKERLALHLKAVQKGTEMLCPFRIPSQSLISASYQIRPGTDGRRLLLCRFRVTFCVTFLFLDSKTIVLLL